MCLACTFSPRYNSPTQYSHLIQTCHVFSVHNTLVPPCLLNSTGLARVFSQRYTLYTHLTQLWYVFSVHNTGVSLCPLNRAGLACIFSLRYTRSTHLAQAGCVFSVLPSSTGWLCLFSPRCSDHSPHTQLHEQAGEHIRCGHRECEQRVLHLLQRGLRVAGSSCAGHCSGPRLSEDEESVHHRL